MVVRVVQQSIVGEEGVVQQGIVGEEGVVQQGIVGEEGARVAGEQRRQLLNALVDADKKVKELVLAPGRACGPRAASI